MKAFWVAVAMAGGVLVGMWWARKGKEASPAPSGGPGASGDTGTVMCPQVIATCKDGSMAPTPCDCASRGGVARVGAML